jgi:surface antigen
MNFRAFAARFALMAACVLTIALPAQASAAASKSRFWQCAVFAREVSSVKIHGNAWTWWEQAAGKYDRGDTPQVGAVMSFKKTGHNPFGHVAMVSRIVNDREVLLTHANWSFAGGIERNVRAVDVSLAGDWSEVKVWFAPTGGLGTTVYPVNGFIYGGGTSEADLPAQPSLELDLSDLVMETNVN